MLLELFLAEPLFDNSSASVSYLFILKLFGVFDLPFNALLPLEEGISFLPYALKTFG